MKKLFGLLFIVIAITTLVAPANAQSAREAIEAALVKFSEAFNSKDAAVVAAHYAEDAAVLPPDSVRIDGRANIKNFWKGAIDAGLSDLTLKAIEVEDQGNWAYEVGELSYSAPGTGDARTTASGKYIVIWKKDTDGSWRLFRDIWNPNPAGSP
jgi:uncharacterized protein (TIGR02246 family)